MKMPSWESIIRAIPAIAMIVTVDQWVGATGAADPFQIDLGGHAFSIMAAARGIVIVLAVSAALQRMRTLWDNPSQRRLVYVLIACVCAMMAIETFVIMPFTMSVMAKSDLAKTLQDIPRIGTGLFYAWALLVSAMSLLAVVTASLASVTTGGPIVQAAKPRPIQIAKPAPAVKQPETLRIPIPTRRRA
jgi:hypothetical protein